jgi:hypothetical protein
MIRPVVMTRGAIAVRGDSVGAEVLCEVARVMRDRGLCRTIMRIAAVGRWGQVSTELTVMILPLRCRFMTGATALQQ